MVWSLEYMTNNCRSYQLYGSCEKDRDVTQSESN